MDTKTTVTINEIEYPLESLSVETQQDLQRVVLLREKAASLSREFNEVTLVLQAYQTSIIKAVEVSDEAEAS